MFGKLSDMFGGQAPKLGGESYAPSYEEIEFNLNKSLGRSAPGETKLPKMKPMKAPNLSLPKMNFPKLKMNKMSEPMSKKPTWLTGFPNQKPMKNPILQMDTFGMARKRMSMQQKVNMFGDADRDGVLNIFDCAPLNPMKQAEVHSVLSEQEKAYFEKIGTERAKQAVDKIEEWFRQKDAQGQKNSGGITKADYQKFLTGAAAQMEQMKERGMTQQEQRDLRDMNIMMERQIQNVKRADVAATRKQPVSTGGAFYKPNFRFSGGEYETGPDSFGNMFQEASPKQEQKSQTDSTQSTTDAKAQAEKDQAEQFEKTKAQIEKEMRFAKDFENEQIKRLYERDALAEKYKTDLAIDEYKEMRTLKDVWDKGRETVKKGELRNVARRQQKEKMYRALGLGQKQNVISGVGALFQEGQRAAEATASLMGGAGFARMATPATTGMGFAQALGPERRVGFEEMVSPSQGGIELYTGLSQGYSAPYSEKVAELVGGQPSRPEAEREELMKRQDMELLEQQRMRDEALLRELAIKKAQAEVMPQQMAMQQPVAVQMPQVEVQTPVVIPQTQNATPGAPGLVWSPKSRRMVRYTRRPYKKP